MREELLKEFIELYRKPSEGIPEETEGIVILTGPTYPPDQNCFRIQYAKKIMVTLHQDVPIIYSGVTEERERMLDLMRQIGIPEELSYFQDCGPIGVANTLTHFPALLQDRRTNRLKNLVLVTDTCYIPRVKRTAGKLLPASINFMVTGDHGDYHLYNSFLLVMSEIQKIIDYSARGDILARPRQ